MKTYCHTSPCGLTEVDAVSAEEFMAMFDRLVWEQDRSYPAGTCPFMAPEQFLQGEGYSPASDLYSLGVTLFMLVTGKLPQQVQTLPATLP
jgi:serine/threonine protein kinase